MSRTEAGYCQLPSFTDMLVLVILGVFMAQAYHLSGLFQLTEARFSIKAQQRKHWHTDRSDECTQMISKGCSLHSQKKLKHLDMSGKVLILNAGAFGYIFERNRKSDTKIPPKFGRSA